MSAERAVRELGASRVSLPTAADLVVDDLRRLIASGLLDDDAELDAGTTLMERYGVSRPTLREALRVLAAERLLELTAGTRKARVRRPSIEVAAQHLSLLLASRGATLADLRDAGVLIELAAVRTLADQPPQTRAEGLRIVGEPGGDHQALVAACGNRTLQLAHELVGSILDQHAPRSATQSPHGPQAAVGDRVGLGSVIRHLEAGDAERAEEAYRRFADPRATSSADTASDGRVIDLAHAHSALRTRQAGTGGASTEVAAIATELRTQIVDGRLEVGTRLAADIHQKYRVSRVTMRSAIRLLETDGLLHVARGARGGVEVTRPTARQAARYLSLLLGPRGVDFRDYAAARVTTGPLVVEQMVRSIDDSGIQRLRDAAALEARMSAAGDVPGFARAALTFQGTVAELSGSVSLDVLTEVLDRLVVAPFLAMLFDPDYEDPRRSLLAAHLRLVEIAQAGDVAAARQSWAALTEKVASDFFRHGSRTR